MSTPTSRANGASSTASLDQAKNTLLKEIRALRERQEKRRQAMARRYTFLVWTGVLFFLGAAVSGFLGMGTVAGATVLLAGISLGLEKLFGYGERRDFNKIVVNECFNLRFALNYRADTEKQVEVVRERFHCLASVCSEKWSPGKGMEAVRRLYEVLDSKGVITALTGTVEEKHL